MAKKKKDISQQEAKEQLWRQGVLSWKLRGKQIDIYNHFKNTEDDLAVVMISRRFGKTFTMCILAVEVCINTPRAVVKYVCPTSKMVTTAMYPTVREIIEDCPEDIKPTWMPSEKKWIFKNGSEIQVAGTENQNYNSVRGGYSNLCIVDEAAFTSELETVIYNVLLPTTDTTGGKLFMASTPNDKDPNHEFHEHFVFPLDTAGKLLKMTLFESPMVDDKQREKIIARYPGGVNNIKFRCEYLCEIPNLTDSNIVPEFSAKESLIVKEIPTPEFCHFYTSMDVGFKDLTVALFGYYNHPTGQLVVVDEYVINGQEMTTNKLYNEIKHKESLRFFTSLGEGKVHLRVMDNDLKLINDLARFYEMMFMPTEKHGKEQAIDTVRRWVDAERLIIHPRCKNLIYHIKYAQWKLTRAGTFTGSFKHLKGNEAAGLLPSHADALDALIYLVRNVQTDGLPIQNITHGRDTFVSPHYRDANKSQGAEIMGKIMNLRKK